MEKAISDGANNVNEEDVSKLKQEIIEMSENYYENRAAVKKKGRKISIITLIVWYLFLCLLTLDGWYWEGVVIISVAAGAIAIAVSVAVFEISCSGIKKETGRLKHQIISKKLKYKKMLREG